MVLSKESSASADSYPMNIIATEDIELLLALNTGQSAAVSTISEKQRHKMISMGFIRHTRAGYIMTALGEKMAKSLHMAHC